MSSNFTYLSSPPNKYKITRSQTQYPPPHQSCLIFFFIFFFQVKSCGRNVNVDKAKVLQNFIFIIGDRGAEWQTTSDMVTLDKYEPLFTNQKSKHFILILFIVPEEIAIAWHDNPKSNIYSLPFCLLSMSSELQNDKFHNFLSYVESNKN